MTGEELSRVDDVDALSDDDLAERIVEYARALELTAALVILLRRSGQFGAFVRAWAQHLEGVLEQVRGDGGAG